MSNTNDKQSITKLLPQLRNKIDMTVKSAVKANEILGAMGLLKPLDELSKSSYPSKFKGKWGISPLGKYQGGEYRVGTFKDVYHRIVWPAEIVDLIAGYVDYTECL
jgi:hypothetical protein